MGREPRPLTLRAAVLAAGAARLQDAVDLDAVSEDLARVITSSLEPAHLSVWVSNRYSGPQIRS